MRSTTAALILLGIVASTAGAAEVKGVGGPEAVKLDPKKIFPVRLDATKIDATAGKARPKGMLRVGQGPFPSLPNPKAEGVKLAK